MKNLKALIFDLDGVITDSAEYHFIAWKNLAAEIGIEIDREFNEKLKGVSRDDSLDKILAHGNKLNDFTDEEKMKLATKKNEEYLKLIEKVTPADILPGISLLLKNAKANGVKLALASASKNGPLILEKLGLSEIFDTIVDPALLKAGKPDPEIFITAAKQLDLSTDVCIGIEDAAAGVIAINAANMFSVGVGPSEILGHANYNVINTSNLDFFEIKERFLSAE